MSTVLQDLDELQQNVDQWHQRTSSELQAMHAKFSAQIRSLEEAVQAAGISNGSNNAHNTSTSSAAGNNANGTSRSGTNANAAPFSKPAGGVNGATTAAAAGAMDWEQLLTPSRTPSRPTPGSTPAMASPPVSHALNYDLLIDEAKNTVGGAKPLDTANLAPVSKNLTEEEMTALRTRPVPDRSAANGPRDIPPQDRDQPCQVLVEFKRKRILQFESPQYVAAGEYVVVGGDRGEDIGLVTHTWLPGSASAPGGKWANGMGTVMRLATVLEVSQLQGVQTELEMRAVEVAQEKVIEHQLPMRIVDAEYQFDRKKLTFYYQSQHRLDFRNLVRDLYKTFRARIWMELD